jgi:protease-4
VIDNVHQQFIDAVAKGRKGKMNRTDVVKVADGRIFTGEQAKELGLVDRMGNLDDTIDIAAEIAGITGKPNVVYPKRKFSIWDIVLEEMATAIAKTLNEKAFQLNYRLVSPVD